MRIAALFSPNAGSNDKFHGIGNILTRIFKNHEVFTGKGNFGEHYLPEATTAKGSVPEDYRSSITYMVLSLLSNDPDMFICVGGDGLAAYVADALITNGSSMPIVGIAGGTANVGPIIAINPDDLELFEPEKLSFSTIGAIHIKNGDRHIAYAFNDVVMGNTFLGTINGETTNISAKELLENNKKTAVTPSSNITVDGFNITNNGEDIKFSIKNPAQIVVSPLEVDRFYGRAITGALCYSAYSPHKAAMGLFEEVIVKMADSSSYSERFTKVEHLLFGPGDIVSITGLSEDGQIIIDGNPYLREHETVTFEYKPNLVKVAKPPIRLI
jgi:hypothetical protein